MGTRVFKNGEAHSYMDEVVYNDREKRAIQQLIAADDARWNRMAVDEYTTSTGRLANDVEAVLRICESGEGVVDQVLEDLRNGDINATEAAKALGAARRDLNRIRRVAHQAEQTEQQVWESIDVSAAEYQQRLMNRCPALFREGCNLLVLPTFGDE
jgi:hypothetical protein